MANRWFMATLSRPPAVLHLKGWVDDRDDVRLVGSDGVGLMSEFVAEGFVIEWLEGPPEGYNDDGTPVARVIGECS